jgi:putative spermidine/putrescine transport system ATP-binding protein
MNGDATDPGFLVLEGVRKEFPGHVAVHGFDLSIPKGSLVSFLGPSGCGKTTTLRMIGGFELPTRGRITIGGRDVTFMPPAARDIGMVFQSYALFPNMSVADNVGFGLRVRGTARPVIRRRVEDLLELVHLAGQGGRYPWQLSGGMQQRVALARALATEPQGLLLDEPLSALDAKIRSSLRAEIRALQQQLRITTVYVTHDQEEALSLSDTVVVMNQGRIEQVGTPTEIYGRPATSFVARFVGTLNVLDTHVIDPGQGRVGVGGQPFSVATSIADMRTGDDLGVAIRPEAIEPVVDAGVDGNGYEHLRGRVDAIQFLGPTVRTRVLLADDAGMLVFDAFNRPSTVIPTIGDPVTLRFRAEACLVLDDGRPSDR